MLSLSLRKGIYTTCSHFRYFTDFRKHARVRMVYLPSLDAGILGYKRSFLKFYHFELSSEISLFRQGK